MDNRINNRDSAPAADSTRRADKRSDEEARVRADRFKRTLQQEQTGDRAEARLQSARGDARADQTRQGHSEQRAVEKGRDLAAAAEVLGRLGLDEEKTGARKAGLEGAGDPARADAASGAAGRSGGGVELGEAGSPQGRPAAELSKEISAIEKAAEKVLEKAESEKKTGTEAPVPDELAVPHLAPWARPEGPTQAPPPPRELPSPAPGAEVYHRLLMGQGPLGAEARLSITQGPLAGLNIHLTQGPGGLKAAVLTQGGSSRQTLTSAMDEVARRLREKGHHLDVRWDAGVGGSGQPSGGAGSSRSR